MKISLVAISVLFLAGCVPSPEELKNRRDEINQQLPKGCMIRDYGSYRSIPIVVVHCLNAPTSTVNYSYGCGKNCTRRGSITMINHND